MSSTVPTDISSTLKFAQKQIKRKLSEQNLNECSREILIARVNKLEAHCLQLKNILQKVQHEKKQRKPYPAHQRPFDFTKYNTRHVALRILYIGWDLQGFAVQEETCETVEEELFLALKRTRLIQSRETSNYHRCGRTDKGVSAFTQTVSIDLRSHLSEGLGLIINPTAQPKSGAVEIDYASYMNKVLPKEIRILAWCPVEEDFSARFSCVSRTYKYFFPKADLNLEFMQSACNDLIGEHDFRNLCKMDVVNGVVCYMRNITQATCKQTEFSSQEGQGEHADGYDMCELTITGKAFLWHQIRCIISLLILVGQAKESVLIIRDLLDIDMHPRKPQYSMASELPLCLYDNEYTQSDLEWRYSKENTEITISDLQSLWTTHAVRARMIKSMLDDMTSTYNDFEDDMSIKEVTSEDSTTSEDKPIFRSQIGVLMPGFKGTQHNPLMGRPKCASLENRITHQNQKRFKLDPTHVEIKIMK